MSSLGTPKSTNWNKIYSGKLQKNSLIISVTSEHLNHIYTCIFKIWNYNIDIIYKEMEYIIVYISIFHDK